MQIKKGNTTYIGFKEIEKGDIVCEVCGKKDRFKQTMHGDAKDFYMNGFECECGNVVQVRIKRTGMNKRYWE